MDWNWADFAESGNLWLLLGGSPSSEDFGGQNTRNLIQEIYCSCRDFVPLCFLHQGLEGRRELRRTPGGFAAIV